jgi:hypothetical protein
VVVAERGCMASTQSSHSRDRRALDRRSFCHPRRSLGRRSGSRRPSWAEWCEGIGVKHRDGATCAEPSNRSPLRPGRPRGVRCARTSDARRGGRLRTRLAGVTRARNSLPASRVLSLRVRRAPVRRVEREPIGSHPRPLRGRGHDSDARVRRPTRDRPRHSMIPSRAPISPLINRNGAWLTGPAPGLAI